MFAPTIELEGTWQEIAAKLPKKDGQRLRVSVTVEDKPETVAASQSPDASPAKVTWDEIFAANSKMQSKLDNGTEILQSTIQKAAAETLPTPRSMTEALKLIAERSKHMESKTDSLAILREGRAGAMWGYDPVE